MAFNINGKIALITGGATSIGYENCRRNAKNWIKKKMARRSIKDHYSRCREWFRCFKDGDFSIEDKPRSGQPKQFEDKELEELLEEDQSQVQEKPTESLGVTEQAFSVRFRYMGMIKKQGVLIADIDKLKGEQAETKLNKQFGEKKALFIKTDATKEDELENAFRQATTLFGNLDIVMNNVGILDDHNWEWQIASNCNSVVHGSLLGLKYMGTHIGGKGGIIVNVSSVFGLQEIQSCPVHTGTKYFVTGLTKSFASPFFFAKTGITFLTMCPGVTSPMISNGSRFTLKEYPDLGPILAKELDDLPMQKPSDVAKANMIMLEKGENGSIWVSEGGDVYEVVLPDRITLKKY